MSADDSARKNGLKAFETVKKVLTEVGWEPEPTDREGVLRVDFSVDQTPIADAIADVRIDYERFKFSINFRDRAPANRRAEVMEFVTRVNFGMITGNYEFDLDSGIVRFRSSIDFTNAQLNEALIVGLIRSAMDAVEAYADSLVAVMRGEMTAVQAIAAAEGGPAPDEA